MLRDLIAEWDGAAISSEQFTVCPSGGSASLIVLAALKERGVKRVLFETPSYFGTIEQAQQIELEYELLPTYRRLGYTLPNIDTELNAIAPVALWITQPRASLGINQRLENIEHWLATMKPTQYLVIDEVTDQSFPSLLGSLRSRFPDANLLRIRSFIKGMGFNGLRLSTIIHPLHLRASLVDAVEAFGGSLDAHSLFAVKHFARDIPRFRAMLYAANEQVNDLRRRAETIVLGSPAIINPLINGYIGSMVVDLATFGATQHERRERFLAACRAERTPVVLGPSFYLAKDPPTEAIRLNFFTHPDQLLRGVVNITRIVVERGQPANKRFP